MTPEKTAKILVDQYLQDRSANALRDNIARILTEAETRNVELKHAATRFHFFCKLWAEHAPSPWQWPRDESFEKWFGERIPRVISDAVQADQMEDAYKQQVAELTATIEELRKDLDRYSNFRNLFIDADTRAMYWQRQLEAARGLLVDSQTYIGGDWRERRDAFLARPLPDTQEEQS